MRLDKNVGKVGRGENPVVNVVPGDVGIVIVVPIIYGSKLIYVIF